jgi:hypothetical protein
MSVQLQAAVDAIKVGDTRTGFEILRGFLAENPDSEKAWWVMSGLVPAERRPHCLREVLRINPENQMAREALERIESSPLQHEVKTKMEEKAESPAPAATPAILRYWLFSKRGQIYLTLLTESDLMLGLADPRDLNQIQNALDQQQSPESSLTDRKLIPLKTILDLDHQRNSLRIIYQGPDKPKSLRLKMENAAQAYQVLEAMEKALGKLL